MFSQACVKNSVHRGEVYTSPRQTPQTDTTLGRHPLGRHLSWAGTPRTPPAGYCSGRYASYWNALLLILFCYMYKYVDQNVLATMLVSRCYTRAESEESRGGGLCPGGLCPGVSVQGDLCPGGSVSRGFLSRGDSLCPGGLCQGDPLQLCADCTHPTGIHSC